MNNNNNYIQETETVQQNKIKIEDHMLLSQQDRQSHIDLTTDCQFHTYTKEYKQKHKHIGDLYSRGKQTEEAKRRLLDFHNIEDFYGYDIHLCHKCSNDSGKDKICINPLHLAFGTFSENMLDKPEKIRKEAMEKARNSMTEHEKFEASSKGGTKAAENGTCGFQQKEECPHCKKKTNLANLKQWHGDNCKLKP
jgi:hypothetical protein